MDTRRVAATDEAGLAEAVARLRAGEVVALPTETVYGLAGLGLEPAALVRIFEAKQRPRFDPLILHIAAPAAAAESPLAALEAAELVDMDALEPAAKQRLASLTEAFWPGPLTLVLPKQPRVPDLATSGLATVAVRMPRHPVAQAVLAELAAPLAAPSANRFGRISPTTAEHVLAELSGRIPLVLDGGPCAVGLESTVLALDTTGTLRLLRPGAVTAEQIAAVAPVPTRTSEPGGAGDTERPAATQAAAQSEAATAPQAPGMLTHHYAPAKPLRLLPTALGELPAAQRQPLTAWLATHRVGHVALLTFGTPPEAAAVQAALRQAGATQVRRVDVHALPAEPTQAAPRFFATLREMDASAAEALLAEPPPHPTAGLAAAIQDRLQRAAAAHATTAASEDLGND